MSSIISGVKSSRFSRASQSEATCSSPTRRIRHRRRRCLSASSMASRPRDPGFCPLPGLGAVPRPLPRSRPRIKPRPLTHISSCRGSSPEAGPRSRLLPTRLRPTRTIAPPSSRTRLHVTAPPPSSASGHAPTSWPRLPRALEAGRTRPHGTAPPRPSPRPSNPRPRVITSLLAPPSRLGFLPSESVYSLVLMALLPGYSPQALFQNLRWPGFYRDSGITLQKGKKTMPRAMFCPP
jgi:hypothetical protein